MARIHHVVAEFTKRSGCLPSILIVDNCIFFTFQRQVRLSSSPFRPGVLTLGFFLDILQVTRQTVPNKHLDFYGFNRTFVVAKVYSVLIFIYNKSKKNLESVWVRGRRWTLFKHTQQGAIRARMD